MSTTRISAALRRLVRTRAQDCCEYCLIPEMASFATHEIDHGIAEKHGGATVEENLALSCKPCNKHKGSDLSSIDPETGEIVRLYQPRRDVWERHFRLEDGVIVPTTDVGRVTVRLLQMNRAARVQERVLAQQAGVLGLPTMENE